MRTGWLFTAFLLLISQVSAVYYGQDKTALIEELGKPTSILAKGGREVLLYKNGRIELQAGKVVFVQGIEVREGAESTVATAEAPVDGQNPVASVNVDASKSVAAPVVIAPKSSPDLAVSLPPPPPRAEIDKAIEQLEDQQGKPAQKARVTFSAFNFAVELGLSWLLMLAALKLTCKYWAVEIAWSGLMLAALADAGVRAVINLVVKLALQMPSAFYADEAVGAFVLVLVLKKVSFNQSTNQAIQVTMTAKVFSVVVGSFLITVIMHALA